MRVFTRNIRKSLLVVLLIGSVGLAACSRGGELPEAAKQAEAFDDLRTEIRAIVSEPERSAEALRLVGTLEQELLAFQEDIRQRRQRMQALNANYDASRADFDAVIRETSERMRENRTRVSGFRQSLRTTLSDEELEALDRTQTQTIKSVINALNAAYQEV
jgi:hypothetical protein